MKDLEGILFDSVQAPVHAFIEPANRVPFAAYGLLAVVSVVHDRLKHGVPAMPDLSLQVRFPVEEGQDPAPLVVGNGLE